MKILYLAPMDSIHSRRWIQYFASMDNAVHAIDIGYAKSESIENAKHHFIQLHEKKALAAIDYVQRYKPIKRELRERIRQIDPDMIHVHWVGYFANMLASFNFHPLIVTPWGTDILINPKISIKFKYIAKRVLKRADVITCDAPHMMDAMLKLGADKSKINI